MQAGWLDDLTNWLKDQLEAIWSALLQLIADVFWWIVETTLGLFASIIEAIPVPSFLTNGLDGLFSGLDPAVLYFVGLFRIPEGLTMLGVAVVFRLTRKLLTLGQW